MRPLVEPNSNKEGAEIVELLLANGVRYLEKPSTFLGAASIWVEDSDYERALDIAVSVDARHAKQAKAEWNQEWNKRYHGSYLRWVFANLHKPANLFRLLLLSAMLAIFVIYPIVYIFRS